MWWHTVTHGRGSEGKPGEWSGYPALFTLPRNVVYPALLPLIRTTRLPVVDWTEAPADLNELVRFTERRNLVSARVPSHLNWPVPTSWQRLYTNFLKYPPFLKVLLWAILHFLTNNDGGLNGILLMSLLLCNKQMWCVRRLTDVSVAPSITAFSGLKRDIVPYACKTAGLENS